MKTKVVALQRNGNGCVYLDEELNRIFMVSDVLAPGPGEIWSQPRLDQALQDGWLTPNEFLDMIGAVPQNLEYDNVGPMKAGLMELIFFRDEKAGKNRLNPIRRRDSEKTAPEAPQWRRPKAVNRPFGRRREFTARR